MTRKEIKAVIIHKNWETGDCLYSIYTQEDQETWITSFATKDEAVLFCEDQLDCDVIDYKEDKEPR